MADVVAELVSILLPVWNGAAYLDESIQSILRQTYENLELLIVDDFSDDSTPEIIEKYKKIDSRVLYHRNSQNLRLPRSLNVGIKMSKGSWITWTSDDNLMKPKHIETLVCNARLRKCSMVYSNFEVIDFEGELVGTSKVGEPSDLVSGNCVGASFLYKSEIHNLIGFYDEKAFMYEDYEMWVRMYLGGISMAAFPEITYQYRVHNHSLSSTRNLPIEYVEFRKSIINKWPIRHRELICNAKINFFQLAIKHNSFHYATFELIDAIFLRPLFTARALFLGLIRKTKRLITKK